MISMVSHTNDGINTALDITNASNSNACYSNASASNYASLYDCMHAQLPDDCVAHALPHDRHIDKQRMPDESPSVLNALIETHGNTALEAAKYSVYNLPTLAPQIHTVPNVAVLRHCDRSLPVHPQHFNKRFKRSVLGNK